MSDNKKKEDADGNFLSPSNGPVRDHMVNTAVNFLQNPKVMHSPLSHKRAFLLKKGLTEREIDVAFQSAGNASSNLLPYNQSSFVPTNYEMREPHKSSIWTMVRAYGSTVIIVGVALYGLHQFYKYYIEPWIFGEKKKEDRMIQFEKQLLELNRSLSQLKRSVASIEEALNVQKEQLYKSISEKNRELHDSINPSFFIDLRADVATVKSLLLSRHQFPDVPKISPTIPEWQLVGGSPEKLTKIDVAPNKKQDKSDQCEMVDSIEQKNDETNSLKSDDEAAENNQQLSTNSIEAVEGQEEHVSLSASSDSFENVPAVQQSCN